MTVKVVSAFPVKMGGQVDTDKIVESLGFPSNRWINQKNFPLNNEKEWTDEIEIIEAPGRLMSENYALDLLADAGLERPTYAHGIRFTEQFGKMSSEEKPSLLFWHEPWKDPQGRDRILCLDRENDRRRWLTLIQVITSLGFNERCALVGVRKY
jgi:hypothetical protein